MDRFARPEVEMIVENTESGLAYITYRPGRGVYRTLELGGEGSEVLVDLNEAGEVLGIEIIDVNIPENLDLARRFATERGLEFPPETSLVAAGRTGSATER